MEMWRTAVGKRAPGISHSSNSFFFSKYLKVLVSIQNRIETLLKCQKPSSQGTNPLLIWGHQLGENIQTKKLYTVVGKISIIN